MFTAQSEWLMLPQESTWVETVGLTGPAKDTRSSQKRRVGFCKLTLRSSTARHIGLDFGTTNSSLAIVDDSRQVRTARFQSAFGQTESFRSVLYFDRPQRSLRREKLSVFAGPKAISRYLDADPRGRLIQSIKSFAPSTTFQSTNVFGTVLRFEELVAHIVKPLVAEAVTQFGPLGTSVTVGRPVRFAGARTAEEEEFALGRIQRALELSGFEQIRFEYEPIGAAWFYESRLDHDELVLIGDFGGGTSDFSLVRVGPGVRRRLNAGQRILGNEGVGVAGDAFDSSVIRHLVSPRLGEGTSFRSVNKLLPVPGWCYRKLEAWHHLSFLKDPETLRMLNSVRATALEQEKLSAFIYLIENELGYQLHGSVQRTKVALSSSATADFNFADGLSPITEQVRREDFNVWTAVHLASIAGAVERLLNTAGVTPRDVDRVFLTGGSSFVPAVRDIFSTRFGPGKVAGGAEFTSVASGLAMCAADSVS